MRNHYSRVISAVDRGQSSEIFEAVRECQDERDHNFAVVQDLLVFLKLARRKLLDGDFEYLIGDIDKQLELHKGLGFNLVEED